MDAEGKKNSFDKIIQLTSEKGFCQVPNWLKEEPYAPLKPIERYCYGEILSMFNKFKLDGLMGIDEKGVAYSLISGKMLASRLGISYITGKKALDSLESVGLIKTSLVELGLPKRVYLLEPVPKTGTAPVQKCTTVPETGRVGVPETGRGGVPETGYMIDRYIDNRIDRDTLSKDKGVEDSLKKLSSYKELLFSPKKGLFSKDVKISDLANLVKSINGNKDKRRKAEAKICLAKASNTWSNITGRDLCYWYAFSVYPKVIGKPMKGEVAKNAKVFADLIRSEKGDAELIFYSLKYIAKLYPLYNTKEAYKEPTLDNLAYCISWKKTQEMIESALDNADRFISDGYIERKSSDRVKKDDILKQEESGEMVYF